MYKGGCGKAKRAATATVPRCLPAYCGSGGRPTRPNHAPPPPLPPIASVGPVMPIMLAVANGDATDVSDGFDSRRAKQKGSALCSLQGSGTCCETPKSIHS